MKLGEIGLYIAQIIDPLIALLLCGIWDQLLFRNKRQSKAVKLSLALILLLSLLIPLVLLIRNQ